MRLCRLVLGAAIAVSLLSLELAAQAQMSKFEVASIKKSSRHGLTATNIQPGGRFVGTETTLAGYVLYAYNLQTIQLVEGPDWMRQTRFDINAKAEGDASKSEIQLMLQSLLEERFRLVVRKEQRELSLQELVVHRTDGRLGDRLIRVTSEEECADAAAKLPRPALPPNSGAVFGRACGPMSAIVRIISTPTKAIVIDKTGLSGVWHASLYYNPDPLRPGSSPDVPVFSTALQEQFGLRANSVRGLGEVLVVQSAQAPTED